MSFTILPICIHLITWSALLIPCIYTDNIVLIDKNYGKYTSLTIYNLTTYLISCVFLGSRKLCNAFLRMYMSVVQCKHIIRFFKNSAHGHCPFCKHRKFCKNQILYYLEMPSICMRDPTSSVKNAYLHTYVLSWFS